MSRLTLLHKQACSHILLEQVIVSQKQEINQSNQSMDSQIHELDSTSFDYVGRIQQLSQCLGRKKTSLKSACTCPPLVISFRRLSVWVRSHVCFTVVFYRGPGQSWFEAGSSHSLRSCPETPWKCCTSQELLLVGAWKQLWLICHMEYTKSFTFLFAFNIERQYQSICIYCQYFVTMLRCDTATDWARIFIQNL